MPDIIFLGTMDNIVNAVLNCVRLLFSFAEQNPFVALMFLAVPFFGLLLDLTINLLGRGRND